MKIRTIYKNGVFKAVDDVLTGVAFQAKEMPSSNVEMKPGKQMEWRA